MESKKISNKTRKKKPMINLKQICKQTIGKFRNLDRVTLALVMILFSIGLLMIYSITSISIYNGVAGDPSSYFRKTLINAAIGICGMLFMICIPYQFLKKQLSFIAVIVCPILLVVTLALGQGSEASNVKSWFKIGGFSIQPAEFVKIGMILAIAWMISKRVEKRTYYLKQWYPITPPMAWGSFLPVIGYIGICTLLILAQPDFGSALIIASVGLLTFMATGIDFKMLMHLCIVGVIVMIAAYFAMQKVFPYQLERLLVYQDPFNHPLGYQNVMGYTAIALGGITGVGIGQSTQKYGYVLEPHNDMISTIVAEELGVVTILIIMAIYLTIAIRCYLTAYKCKDIYGSVVSIGIGTIFLIQPLVNLGGASGAIPLTGVTLPFISYGGSSLMALFIGIGVYLNVRIETIEQQKRIKKEKDTSIKAKVVQFQKP